MHQDEGHYAGKHPDGTGLNEAAAAAAGKRIKNGRISCRAAHEAAEEAGVSPAVLGQTLDLLEVRIIGCQLGLFGNKGEGAKPAENTLNLPEEIKSAADENGISCLGLWKAAERSGRSKADAAAICNANEIKIHTCQLGAF